jgi:hypothetical protein
MRIERGDHAVDRAFDQRTVARLLDIVGPHALEHLAEQAELGIGVDAGRRLGARNELFTLRPGHKQGQARTSQRPQEKQNILPHSFALSALVMTP